LAIKEKRQERVKIITSRDLKNQLGLVVALVVVLVVALVVVLVAGLVVGLVVVLVGAKKK
jgi:hypothetical protein